MSYTSAMPALANIRHERFCREYIRTGVAARAYKAAGYTANTRNVLDASASQLLRHPKVKSRIGELRRQMSYKTRITLESLLNDLAEDRTLARSLGQPAAAIQATNLAAKLVGLMVERKESGQPGDFANMQSVEEIVAKVRADLGEEAAKLVATALDRPETEPSDEMPAPTSSQLN